VGDIAYGPALLAEMVIRCEADPEREACGFVVERRPGDALEVVPVQNVADRWRAQDPVRFPRTSRESYLMDPRAQLRLMRELDATRGRVVAIWHSHVESGAHFSAKDRADALEDGRPLVPGVEYLVFGLRGGNVGEAKRYVFQDGDFVERPLG
jgi:[CysO sulfur-carrier protein]-S-L-cysteine hydrolase